MGAPVILALHRLKKSEEGQTLVLAAIFGLVLMLCVLGTVNLGRAVYDKVQLQAAADSSAYSLAAVEARVMNFTAYTNRAMVVHYASIMAATSYLTWVHFYWAGLKPLLDLLSKIPWPGAAFFGAIEEVFQVLVKVLDWGVVAMAPLLSFANLYLYALQEGAWTATYLRLLKEIQPEAHSGDSAALPYKPIWPRLLPIANATVFSQTRGHALMLDNTLESLKILLNDRSQTVQLARLHMMEVANSARQPWTAYGDHYDDPSVSPLARHFKWGFDIGPLSIGIGNVARTEMGGYAPSSGILGTIESAPPVVWSGQRLQFTFHLWPFPKLNKNLFAFVAMDQMYNPFIDHITEWSYFLVWKPPWWAKALQPLFDEIQAAASATGPDPDVRLFWMSPYVYFSPQPRSQPPAGLTSPLGNFAQPDVVVGLALQGTDYNRELGADKYYGHKFTWNGNGAGTGSVDFSYTDKDWPQLGGVPVLHRGLNAFAAAQAYYHRPGDWREQPNFFNPLWGARLMPIKESNVLAKSGLGSVTLLTQYLLH
jgi:hypothetical protein